MGTSERLGFVDRSQTDSALPRGTWYRWFGGHVESVDAYCILQCSYTGKLAKSVLLLLHVVIYQETLLQLISSN